VVVIGIARRTRSWALIALSVISCAKVETSAGPPSAAPTALIQPGPVTCAAPELRDALGPLYPADPGPSWNDQSLGQRWPLDIEPRSGMGVTVADFTGDGLVDVFLPMFGPSRLFVQQSGGQLVDESASRLVADAAHDADTESATAADVDGDGDLDLALFNRDGPNALLYNDDGVLTARDGQIDGFPAASISGAFADMDADGDLDLVVANHDPVEEPPEPLDGGDDNELYRNLGDGTFELANELWPASVAGAYTFVATFIDLDHDGFMDIYLSNDRGPTEVPNRYYRNLDGLGTFVDASDATSTGIATGAMGLAVGDVNGDAWVDLYITNWGPMKAVESFGDGTWYQAEAARGLRAVTDDGGNATWGLELVDLDHDMDLDLPVVAGPIMLDDPEKNPPLQADALMLYDEATGVFENHALEWGWASQDNHRGLVVVDLDRDGWLDLVARDLNGSAALSMSRCGASSWLTVDLAQPGMNRFAIGARVEVDAGGTTQRRWVFAGGTSFAASGPPQVHFGLADHDVVDEVRVFWPDGAADMFPGPIPVNQHVRVERGG
jgi:hypothetical protein